jgi:hypothetical protein
MKKKSNYQQKTDTVFTVNKLVKLLLPFLLFLFSCDSVTSVEEEILRNVEFSISLPKDENGYYHLQLDTTRFQTLYRIDGTVYPFVEYKRLEWGSNLFWYKNGEPVPTTNHVSYTNDTGKFYNMIAPVLTMSGDTLILDVHWDNKRSMDSINDYNPNKNRRFRFVLH